MVHKVSALFTGAWLRIAEDAQPGVGNGGVSLPDSQEEKSTKSGARQAAD
jgi:hypothetical protein